MLSPSKNEQVIRRVTEATCRFVCFSMMKVNPDAARYVLNEFDARFEKLIDDAKTNHPGNDSSSPNLSLGRLSSSQSSPLSPPKKPSHEAERICENVLTWMLSVNLAA